MENGDGDITYSEINFIQSGCRKNQRDIQDREDVIYSNVNKSREGVLLADSEAGLCEKERNLTDSLTQLKNMLNDKDNYTTHLEKEVKHHIQVEIVLQNQFNEQIAQEDVFYSEVKMRQSTHLSKKSVAVPPPTEWLHRCTAAIFSTMH